MDISEFEKRHNDQVAARSQRDVFSIWLALMFLSVVTAHFALNVFSDGITGNVVASNQVTDQMSSLMVAIGFFLVTALIGGLAYRGITKNVD